MTLTQVSSLSQFPKECHIAQFFGRTYEEAIGAARLSGLPLSYYYEQKHGKIRKSILASY